MTDPIAGIPPARQRAVNRTDFGWQWPFSVGLGTLGCSSGAVVFRAAGVTYALNDAARSRGYAPATPIRVAVPSAAPSHPLARLKQNERMQIFASITTCDHGVGPIVCRQRVRDSHGLSDADVRQVEAEGLERTWPPLVRPLRPLQPVVEAGVLLCR
ncbi:MAG TPA: DUF2511 domain-containing protein [Vicinamibacterales bacterium]|nr:DUF2511 domain-containing protein [Vicinamibacterales bacterium]